MRVAVVVAAMLFCMPVFAQGVKLKSVTNLIGMELIEIPAGKFRMGSPEDEQGRGRSGHEAQVTVTLTKPFGLGRTEVTQGQWQQVMGENFGGREYNAEYKNFPAWEIAWDEATEFCERLTDIDHEAGKLPAGESYRLPTEAEWEYACRAGTPTAFSFGDDESELGDYAWFKGNTLEVGDGSEEYARKVGMKKPNPWGLYDMHGNVLEWVSDSYAVNLAGGSDPVGGSDPDSRVNRGGSYMHTPALCRSAFRSIFDPTIRIRFVGFRVARSQSVQ